MNDSFSEYVDANDAAREILERLKADSPEYQQALLKSEKAWVLCQANLPQKTPHE